MTIEAALISEGRPDCRGLAQTVLDIFQAVTREGVVPKTIYLLKGGIVAVDDKKARWYVNESGGKEVEFQRDWGAVTINKKTYEFGPGSLAIGKSSDQEIVLKIKRPKVGKEQHLINQLEWATLGKRNRQTITGLLAAAAQKIDFISLPTGL